MDHNAQQLFGDGARAPAGAVEDLVIACEVGGLSPAGPAQAGGDGPLAGCQQGTHHQNEYMLPTGGSEARAPRLQPKTQYHGNEVADNGVVWVQHPMLRIPTDAGCNAPAVALLVGNADAHQRLLIRVAFLRLRPSIERKRDWPKRSRKCPERGRHNKVAFG
jgi:hypothetical protein